MPARGNTTPRRRHHSIPMGSEVSPGDASYPGVRAAAGRQGRDPCRRLHQGRREQGLDGVDPARRRQTERRHRHDAKHPETPGAPARTDLQRERQGSARRAWPPSPRPQGRHRRERPGRRRRRRLCSSPGSRDSLPPHQPSSFAPPPPPEPRPAAYKYQLIISLYDLHIVFITI